MSYISKEAFLEHIRKDPLFYLVDRYGVSDVVESFPAADVAPVVRCKDCKYYFTANYGECEMLKERLAAYKREVNWNDEFYCAFGKREDGVD